MVRVAAISDTHGRQNWEMPDCDVFVHAGDMTGRGSLQETALLAARLGREMERPGGPAHAIIVPGNHDECFQTNPGAATGLFGPNVHVLIDVPVEIEGLTFYGSPWTPPFMRWHFMADEARLAMLFGKMPAAVDVLVTHGPPYGILDPASDGGNAGSVELLRAVVGRKVRHHFFGHLHAAGGRTMRRGETHFYNVAACDEQYTLVNQPRVVEA